MGQADLENRRAGDANDAQPGREGSNQEAESAMTMNAAMDGTRLQRSHQIKV